MSGVAGVVRWDRGPVAPGVVERMVAPVRHRGARGWSVEARAGVGLGQAIVDPVGDGGRPPPWEAGGRLAVVADCRLHNRRELDRWLGLPATGDPVTDPGRLLAAYRRCGEALLERVEGEFAFALWDARRRQLLLARDPGGARPLFFHAARDRFAFASEPKQLLALGDLPVQPDELLIGEFLLGRFEELDRTFFTGVRRLRPASRLLVDGAGDPRPRRFWRPDPNRVLPAAGRRDLLRRFRDGFARAIDGRLDGPLLAAHLSGGLDSSAVVVTAAELLESRRPGTELHTVGCVYAGLECDESRFQRAVAARVGLRHHEVDALAPSPLAGIEEDLWRLDSPFADLQRGQFLAISEVVRELGAGTVLTGLGGDELILEEAYLQDLAARGRWARLGGELLRASRYTHVGLGWLVRDALRPVAPRSLRAAYRRSRGRSGWRPPAWATPDFAHYFTGLPAAPAPPAAGYPIRTQETAFRNLLQPEICWAVEALECRAAAYGYRPTHPFLDRRLAELVLSIPLDDRLPRGRWKMLLRDGVGDALPPLVRGRRGKALFDPVDRLLLHREWRALRERVLDGGEWRSAAYVARPAVERLFRRCADAERITTRLSRDLWRIAMTELWLRQIGRYNRPSEPPVRDQPRHAPAAASPA